MQTMEYDRATGHIGYGNGHVSRFGDDDCSRLLFEYFEADVVNDFVAENLFA